MMGRTRNFRSDNTSYCDFLMVQPSSERRDNHERIAESLLLTWLTDAAPNIRGLRRVDESKHEHRLAMIHIAIPLEYKRIQLAQALGIDQLADDKKTPRVNLIASAAWNEPHSYIRVQAFIDADRSRRTLRLAIKRSGISNSVEYQDEVARSDLSIRFAAAEAPKLFPQSPASFDVHAETPDHRREPGERGQPSRNPGKLADGPPHFARGDGGFASSARNSVSAKDGVVGPEGSCLQANAILALRFA